MEQARLAAQRVRADRMPDPTIGVFTSSEAGGSERVTGISLSFPLSGSYREQAARQAQQQQEMAQAGFEQQRRELELQLAMLMHDLRGSTQRWQQAHSASQALEEIAVLTQKAYAAGEAEVHALLMARRQALEAKNTAQAERIEALRAYARLLIETGRMWDGGADAARRLKSE